MAQPNVQREPSMEEILASIRQIIESNEPGASRGISASLPPVYGVHDDVSDIHLTVDDDYADETDDAAAQRADPRFVAANSSGSVPEPEIPARALSLADVAARVRAATERQAPAPREVPAAFRPMSETQPVPPAAPQEEVRFFETSQAPAPVATPAPRVQQPLERSLQATTVAQSGLAALLPQATSEPVLAEPMQAPAEVETAAPQAQPVAESQALISEDASHQIARSFEALSEALEGAERRSLSEVAEGLLRPMLREWLDDNLPTLVERLVREEIERVARGPRR